MAGHRRSRQHLGKVRPGQQAIKAQQRHPRLPRRAGDGGVAAPPRLQQGCPLPRRGTFIAGMIASGASKDRPPSKFERVDSIEMLTEMLANDHGVEQIAREFRYVSNSCLFSLVLEWLYNVCLFAGRPNIDCRRLAVNLFAEGFWYILHDDSYARSSCLHAACMLSACCLREFSFVVCRRGCGAGTVASGSRRSAKIPCA